MSQPFLITGLPRSRTAWFSVACTSPVSICHHDPTRITSSFDDLKAIWRHPSRAYVGMSDSGLGFQLGRILAEVMPRTLIIGRDQSDVWRSLAAYLPEELKPKTSELRTYLLELEAKLVQWKGHRLVKTVAFDALNDVSVVAECLEWLMPGGNFEHVPALMDMNIQVKAEATRRHLSEPRLPDWWRT